jgi:GntR family transcriptional regulator
VAAAGGELERDLAKVGGRPLYQQLYEILRDRVRRGELQPGDRVPPESALTRSYGVSRITVRAALDQLVQDGLIDRHRGRGSFVREPTSEARTCLNSFTQQVVLAGRVPTTDLLGLCRAPAAGFAPVRLPFEPTTPVVRIERLRRVDGERVALVRSYLPERLVPGIAATSFAARGPGQSLLYVLEHRFGVVLDKGEETLIPAGASPADADLLGIRSGAPVAVRVCRVDDLAGAACLYEEAIWCAPQTQLVQRVAAPAIP